MQSLTGTTQLTKRLGRKARMDAPPRAAACHRGRLISNPLAREMAAMLGVVVCPVCLHAIALKGRQGTILRPPGAGWRELAG
jgi:hypothetical protein